MYKHNASSIKESNEKSFISKMEKDKFNNYPNIFIDKEEVYTKSEFDNIVNDLDFSTEVYNGQFINVKGTHSSSIEFHEIKGNSLNPIYSSVQSPEIENGDIDITTGEDLESDIMYRTKDFISVQEGDVLNIYVKSTLIPVKNIIIIKYDGNKNFIESTQIDDSSYNVGCEEFIRFCYNINDGNKSLLVEKNTIDQYSLISVGELQKNGKYKLSIEVCGKNIIGDKWEQGSVDGITGSYTTKTHPHFYNRIRSKDFLPIDKSKNVISYSLYGEYKAAIRFFDASKNFIRVNNIIGFLPVKNNCGSVEIPSNAEYYKIVIGDQSADGNGSSIETVQISPESVLGVDLKIQFEYGSEITDYVQYKSNKTIDILLPCKLERIGNVSDRLFRRGYDGKLCVEKNIKTRILSSSDKFVRATTLDTEFVERYKLAVPDIRYVSNKYYPVFSNKIRCVITSDSKDNTITDTCTNIFGHNDTSYVHIKRQKTETLFTDTESLNQLMLNSELKYVTNKPEIIELDETPQWLLNAFNDTTCVFVTNSNVQPSSIKVSLPTSLMNVTNMLSKSIRDIDNRISNISTNYKNIQSVYSTSNGSLELTDNISNVCEEVRIEGKSMINYHSPTTTISQGHYDSYDDITGYYTFTASGIYKNLFTDNFFIKPNTQYTIFAECIENTLTGGRFTIIDYHEASSFIPQEFYFNENETGVKVRCVMSKSIAGEYGLRSFLSNSATEGSIKIRLMIIEGDHTDKPLMYFKGGTVKSVGDDLSTKYICNLASARKTIQTGLTYDSITKTYKSTVSQTRFVSEPINVTNNKTYTLSYEFMCNNDITVTTENSSMICRIDAEDASGVFVKTYAHHEIGKKYTAGKWYIVNTKLTIDNSTIKRILPCIRNNVSGVTEISMRKVMVIEGDHTTTNLPYFEGNKSIDTPITITSANLINLPNNYVFKDINLSDGTGQEVVSTSRGRIATEFIDISDNSGSIEVLVHGNKCDKVEKICFYNANKTYIYHKYNNFKQKILKTDVPKDAVYIRIVLFTVEYEKPLGMYVNTKDTSIFTNTKSIQHLQYGDWQPTILRSLPDGTSDTIEKHSDGKYYYHKRCGTYTINSDSDIKLWSNPTVHENTECFIVNYVKVNQHIDEYKNNGMSTSLPHVSYHDIYHNELEGVNINNKYWVVGIRVSKSKATDVKSFKAWLVNNPIEIVFGLAEEEVYECSNLDLMLFNGGTTIGIHSGTVIPTVTMRTSGSIGNNINNLKNRLIAMENKITEREVFHNRLMLNNRYSADKTIFNVDIHNIARHNNNNVDMELVKLIAHNILSDTNSYRHEYIEELIDFYTMIDVIPFEIAFMLFDLIESQCSNYTEIE